MAVFAISFRIGDEGDRNARWSSVVERIKKEATGATWEETTSFFLIRSSKSADGLASSIYTESSMHSTWDKLLVINLSKKDYATRGGISYPATLGGLMDDR